VETAQARPFMNIEPEDNECDNTQQYFRMNVSYETEVHNIFDPQFSDTQPSEWDEGCSAISLEEESKIDPRIYSGYSEDDDIDFETSAAIDEVKQDNFMPVESPLPVIHELKGNRIDEAPSIDNTQQMSTTLPSFNFSFEHNKGIKNEGMSLLYNSRKYEQPSKDLPMTKFEQNTIDSLETKLKIPEESTENFKLNTSSLSHSRNINILDNKGSDMSKSSSSAFKKGKKFKTVTKVEIYPEALSEYSAKTPSSLSNKSKKITKTLKTCKKIIKTSRNLKDSANSLEGKKGSAVILEVESKEDMASNLFKKTPNNYKRLSGQRTDYKTLANKKKMNKGGYHKYNRSYASGYKNTHNLTRFAQKSRVNYSVYLSQNQTIGEPEFNILDRLNTNNDYISKKNWNLKFDSSQSSPKMSNSSSIIIANTEPQTAPLWLGYERDGKKKKLANMTSPSSIDSPKTVELKPAANETETITYNLDHFKNEFEKVHSKNINKQKSLKSKLQKLKKKTNNIKKQSTNNWFSKLKYLQVNLQKTKTTTERRKSPLANDHSGVNKSKKQYSSKQTIINNYWKHKTTNYGSNSFFNSKSPIRKRSDLQPFTGNNFSKSPKVSNAFFASEQKKTTKLMKGKIRKNSPLASFSKKIKLFGKQASIGGYMSGRVSKNHTRNPSDSFQHDKRSLLNYNSPKFSSKNTNRGFKTLDLSSPIVRLR